jgi:transcriptional regulator with XRE-family HTH domain
MTRIRAARLGLGLTQAQAAERIGWAQSTWAGRESGARMPTLATAIRMASAVGLVLNVARRSTSIS